jgi:hypothetical protein
MADEIAQLQAQLADACAAAREPLHFKRHSDEYKIATKTIKEYINELDSLLQSKAPFVERITKAIALYTFMMANPNILAAERRLRSNSNTKANEFLNEPFQGYADQPDFAANLARLRATMQNFLTWVEDILPHNVHYVL